MSVINEGNVSMNSHSDFLYEHAQNAPTTYEHMKKFIHWMYYENLLIKDDMNDNTADGCIKQYICTNALWLFLVLKFTYIVVIDRCSNDPRHGIRKINGINVSDKSYLRHKCA